MKNKLKDLLKVGVLIFGIMLFLYNCEKESPDLPETNSDLGFKVTQLQLDDLQANRQAFEIVEGLKNKGQAKTASKTKTFHKYNFTLNTDDIVKVENGAYHSFTLPIYRDYKTKLTENLIVSFDVVSEVYKTYIISYKLNAEEKQRFLNGEFVDLTDKTNIETLKDFDASQLFSKEAQTEETDCWKPIYCCGGYGPIVGWERCGGGGGGDFEYRDETRDVDVIESEFETDTGNPCNTCSGSGGSSGSDTESEDNESSTVYTVPSLTTLEESLFKDFSKSLSLEQNTFLNKTENASIKAQLVDFLNQNISNENGSLGYAEEAVEFAESALDLDIILASDFGIVSTGKLPDELSNCCPGDCCPDVSLYSDDRIVYEYGIQPVQAAVDGTFNLIIGTSELIGSDEWAGSRIRKMMLEIGVSVPADIDNVHLSNLYRIRKRDGIVIIEYRPGLLKSMLDVGLDTLDVLAFLSPAKGGGPALFTKIGGSVSVTAISKHIRDITISATKIDNVVNDLKSSAKFALEGTGAFKTVGGHHPLAKIAFKSDKFYDLQKAFSVSISKLEQIEIGIHAKITGQQNSLYSAFAKTGEVLTLDKMAEIEIKAMVNAGVPEDVATGWVIKALEDLKAQGVKMITNIPWNGLN